ncbi:MAG: hypothetical protein KGI07_08310 [Thaumarchaeota archaeon]|nr:hypothetical protein [Nitrososphaerota archaeon]
MKRYLWIILVGILLTQVFSISQVFAVYPCGSPYCPDTSPGYQYEDFRLKYTPTICEVEPNDTRFPNLAQTVITTTHQSVQNWITQLNNGSGKNSTWKMNEIIIPPSDQINPYSPCNITIVYESQELDYCGETYNGVYFPCGSIFNGITIPNPQTNTALIFIPYLMPIYGKQCEYEKNGITYDLICRSQQEIESNSRLLKAIQHEIGHALGLGHFIANSQDEAGRWVAGTETVPSIMVSGQEGGIEYAKVTVQDANAIRSIYGTNGFNEISTSTENMQYLDSLRLQTNEAPIPHWIKNVTNWWSQGKINDSEFKNCIKYLVQQGTIRVHVMKPILSIRSQEIPSWLKNIASWWASSQAEDTFFSSIIQWIMQTPTVTEPTKQDSSSIVITTDKSSYSMGDTIIISGTIKPVVAGTSLIILILDPNNLLVQSEQISVSTDGIFQDTITTTPSIWKSSGTYTASVQYGTSNIKEQTTFYFTGY